MCFLLGCAFHNTCVWPFLPCQDWQLHLIRSFSCLFIIIEKHKVCGSVLAPDVVARFKVVQLACAVVNEANPATEATAIAVYHVTGGVDCCRVGFLRRHLIKYKDEYDARLAQITMMPGLHRSLIYTLMSLRAHLTGPSIIATKAAVAPCSLRQNTESQHLLQLKERNKINRCNK